MTFGVVIVGLVGDLDVRSAIRRSGGNPATADIREVNVDVFSRLGDGLDIGLDLPGVAVVVFSVEGYRHLTVSTFSQTAYPSRSQLFESYSQRHATGLELRPVLPRSTFHHRLAHRREAIMGFILAVGDVGEHRLISLIRQYYRHAVEIAHVDVDTFDGFAPHFAEVKPQSAPLPDAAEESLPQVISPAALDNWVRSHLGVVRSEVVLVVLTNTAMAKLRASNITVGMFYACFSDTPQSQFVVVKAVVNLSLDNYEP